MLFAILWVLFSLVIAGVAKQTGRNPGAWFFIAFLTSPVIGGLILLIAYLFNGKVVREQPKVVTTGCSAITLQPITMLINITILMLTTGQKQPVTCLNMLPVARTVIN